MLNQIRTRNIILLIILLLLFLPFPIYSLTYNDYTANEAAFDKEEQYTMGLEIAKKQAPAKEAADKIYAAVGEGPDFSKKHLDTYGGMYLDFEGNLYVVITEYTQSVMDQYKKMADGFENIIFVKGKYNYNELYKIYEEIVDFAGNNRTNINSVGIDDKANMINITIFSNKAKKNVVRIEKEFAHYPIRITNTIDKVDVSINH